MERPESPWSLAKDNPPGSVARPGAPTELAPDDPPRARAPDWTRLFLILVVAIGLAAAGFLLAKRLIAQSALWLGRQPTYQVAFRDIELIEKPPPWFRGGERAFLEGVRRAAGMPERFSTLETRPDQLLAAFKEAPWVEEAVQATYMPGSVQVRVIYQRPVAYVQLEGGEQFLVDARATVLAPEDVDSERLGPLAKIVGNGLLRPVDPRPGVVWKSDQGGTVGPDPRIVAAARLAGFLVQAEAFATLGNVRIILSAFAERGLFVETDRGIVLWWRSAPGDERPDEPAAAAKWSMLKDWVGSKGARILPESDYMAFSSKGLVQKCPHPHRPHLGVPQSGRLGDGEEP